MSALSLFQYSQSRRTALKHLSSPYPRSSAVLPNKHEGVESLQSQHRLFRSSSAHTTATRGDRRRFSIQVNFGQGLSSLNENARKAVLAAAKFWEKIITGSVDGPKRVVIRVDGQRLAPETLASALPTKYDDDFFPTRGVTTINTRLRRDYNKNPKYLRETIIHEFAHVLGIGTLWFSYVDSDRATYSANSNAGQVYGALLGSSTPVPVPLEPDLYHWNENALGNEIMTPDDNGKCTRDPVSVLTIAALQDLGWKVNYNAAQPYTLSQVSRSLWY